jgi:hypothetical protein
MWLDKRRGAHFHQPDIELVLLTFLLFFDFLISISILFIFAPSVLKHVLFIFLKHALRACFKNMNKTGGTPQAGGREGANSQTALMLRIKYSHISTLYNFSD